MKKILLLIMIIASFISCKKEESSSEKETDIPQESFENPWRENPYKLNVIYFIPSDLEAIPFYKERISEILLDAQVYIADNMEREGFERKSFGLDLLNDTTVNIITIKGKFSKDRYPDEDGDLAIIPEIENYYSQNPNIKRTSQHDLIIIPKYNDNDEDPLGGPFFAVSRTAFAMDLLYLDQNYLYSDDEIEKEYASQWIGGLVHELCHGLNVEHNIMRPSLRSSLGTALLGAGNLTYKNSKTSLTGASAAQLNNSQALSKKTRNDWYITPTFELTELTSTFNNNNIKINGKFNTNGDVKDIVIWHDPAPYGIGDDYDAISWNTKTNDNNTFEFNCNLNEFEKKSGEYEIRIGFLHTNGSVIIKKYTYMFKNNIPVFNNISIQ